VVLGAARASDGSLDGTGSLLLFAFDWLAGLVPLRLQAEAGEQ
jgi:hypothetical protein